MTTIVNFKTDKKVKGEAQKIANRMGLNLSDVLNVYLRKFIIEKEIHISLEEPSDWLINELKEADKEAKEGNISPSFNNAKDAIKWLNDKNRKYGNQI
ncbi:MAG TPA: type II toxin-antitoxin system RelB/DinJ family antitoxin [Candidatus Pacearchaeota archaeon]|nr:type II toxin-antitoxin system RelB/DinJ family antitoxin [Candidatus Pacearchaeota archaeon]HPR79630.1 type II toxin-antitoxin system RelB/DinJ family antitoxin [Candidatus Pacearchaeota archaeon]